MNGGHLCKVGRGAGYTGALLCASLLALQGRLQRFPAKGVRVLKPRDLLAAIGHLAVQACDNSNGKFMLAAA